MRRILLALAFFCAASAPAFAGTFTIDVPSTYERTFGEKRDFYVVGSYSTDVTRPGNIRIELFQGFLPLGTPVRVIESRVEDESGLTPASAIDTTYPNGINHGLTMVPDLVKEPGGILNPGNKVVVAPAYYAGLLLGGCTKGFDTTYRDAAGTPLKDLTAGVYTVRVTGLSGDLAGASATLTILFGTTHMALGRFKPPEQVEALTAFARAHFLRLAVDPFPGNFWRGPVGYEINNRWRPNNAIEVVNTQPGTLLDTPAVAQNDLVVYNINSTCATQMTEIGTLAKTGLVDAWGTTFRRYDIGEPVLFWTSREGFSIILDGVIEAFPAWKRLAVSRVETVGRRVPAQENAFRPWDATPRDVNVEPGNGARLSSVERLSVFGTVKPIPSAVTAGPYTDSWNVENRISSVRFEVKTATGRELHRSAHDVALVRYYDPAQPTWGSPSLYEFRSEIELRAPSGRHMAAVVGLDAQGAEVFGAGGAFEVEFMNRAGAAGAVALLAMTP